MMIYCLMFMTTFFKKMDIGFQGSVFEDFLHEFEDEKIDKIKTPIFLGKNSLRII